jgi:hypothetical protein
MRLLSRSITAQICQLGAGFARMPVPTARVARSSPSSDIAAVVPPQDIGAALAVVVAVPAAQNYR